MTRQFDVVVVGVDKFSLKDVSAVQDGIKALSGIKVKSVEKRYFVNHRALLGVTVQGGGSQALAAAIEDGTFKGLDISVVGMSLHRLELEARKP